MEQNVVERKEAVCDGMSECVHAFVTCGVQHAP